MKYKFVDGDGNVYIGIILFQYTDYSGTSPLSVLVVKTDADEIVHLSATCLVAVV